MWEAAPASAKVTTGFARDGQSTLLAPGPSILGTYPLNGDELEWTVNGRTKKYKV